MIINSKLNTKKNLVIASHSLGEAITKCVIDHKQVLNSNITIVLIQELISDYDIFDTLGDQENIIRWKNKDGKIISNLDYYLLNRVLYVPKHLFIRFSKKDKEYAQREFEAYLGFAFNSFSGIGNQSATGICGDLLSLPQQWKIINDKFNLNVPQYYWGPCFQNNLKEKNNLVYSNIYNYLKWSASAPAQKQEQEHIFCFEKPHGEPVFILSIGNKQLITSDKTIPQATIEQLKKIASKINLTMNYFISEILLFFDGTTLNFGCINHEIIRSSSNIHFNNFVCKNLIHEFYTCIS